MHTEIFQLFWRKKKSKITLELPQIVFHKKDKLVHVYPPSNHTQKLFLTKELEQFHINFP